MPNAIPVAQPISLHDAQYDEFWLRDQIFDNPTLLGLGDLEAVQKERRQSSGGRLDLLLRNPEDDSLYEVELMRGETDETHIIRTIEYWDNERRLRPQHQHYAVLVAEHINRRFFNVIHLLSYSIPIIAIQVALLEVGGQRSLYFTKMLDTYEEPEDSTSFNEERHDRDYWKVKSSWTLEAADALVEASAKILDSPTLNFVKNYIAVVVGGYNYMWLHKRSFQKSLLGFKISPLLQDEVAMLLDEKNITYVRKPNSFRITVDKEMIEKNLDVFASLAKFVKLTWEAS